MKKSTYKKCIGNRQRILVSILLLLFSVFSTSCSNPLNDLLEMNQDTSSVIQYEHITIPSQSDSSDLDNSSKDDYGKAEIHFIDVGQGDCTLILCDEHAMLIDTGDNSKGTAIQNYLNKQGVETLDYLILTHPDADHIGGADVIITKFDIEKIFMSSFTKDNKTYNEMIDAMNYKSYSWSTPKLGDTYSLGNSSFTILSNDEKYDDPNNSSIVLLYQNGENRFLFTGDAEMEAEESICDSGYDLNADVYQVGHHGSSTASSKSFMDLIKPTYAVISCGIDNKYGHPHSETLNTLRDMGILLFRTDEQGTIVATSDGTHITWNCAPTDSWQAGE